MHSREAVIIVEDARPKHRRLLLLTTLASALLTCAPMSAVSASEAVSSTESTSTHTTTQPQAERRGDNPTRRAVVRYRRNWVFRSGPMQRCAFVEVTARLIGRWRWAYRLPDMTWDHQFKYWLGFRLKNPAVHVIGWRTLGDGCDSTSRWRIKARIEQGWFHSGCALSVDVGVGYPWSVQATPHYRCDTHFVGHRASTEGPSRKALHQWNTGVPLRFDGVIARRSQGVGFSGKVLVRIFKRNASDQFRGRFAATIK